MATLQEIKDKLGVEELNLYRSTDADGNPQPWLRHWDNERRVSVSIHEDLASELAQDKRGKITSLSTQYEKRVPRKEDGTLGEPYDSYRIIRYTTEAELVL